MRHHANAENAGEIEDSDSSTAAGAVASPAESSDRENLLSYLDGLRLSDPLLKATVEAMLRILTVDETR
jgi:hypothetical protein